MSLVRRLGAPFRRLCVLVVFPLALALSTLAGCGGGDQTTVKTTGLGDLTLPQLTASLETEAAEFLERSDSALGVSLHEFLGPEIATEVERGSAECRRGRDTASIEDPKRYPFACVVRGSADGQGLLVEITLGFVGTGVEGRCWHAVNERVLVTTTRPSTLSRREATKPPNRLQGCAE
jgi:hypothetical protein